MVSARRLETTDFLCDRPSGIINLSLSIYMLLKLLLQQAPRKASLGNKRPGRQFWNEHIFMLLSLKHFSF